MTTKSYLEPTQEAGRAFFTKGLTGSVVMLNLLPLVGWTDQERAALAARRRDAAGPRHSPRAPAAPTPRP